MREILEPHETLTIFGAAWFANTRATAEQIPSDYYVV